MDYKELLKKAQEEQAEKIAAEQERLRKQKEEEERKAAEEKARQEELERQRRIEEEQKRQEQLAQEARKRAEEEERRRQEAERLERERQERTQRYVNEIAQLHPKMQECEKKGLKASVSEIDKILKEFDEIKNRYSDLYNAPVNSDANRIYNVLMDTKNKIYERQRKNQKTRKIISIAAACFVVIALITGAVIGLNKYHATEAYQVKLAAKETAKQQKLAEKEQERILKSYKVGGWGQAGVIFYDKGEYSDGWRFLEIAPTKSQNRYFGFYSVNVEGLQTELGTGDANTQKLVEEFEEDSAAYYAANYSSGGKDDWYLGNIAEMQMCYKNLVSKSSNQKKIDKLVELGKIDQFYSRYWGYYKEGGTICYLTSEQKDKSNCYTLCFSSSSTLLDGGKPLGVGNDWKAFKHSMLEGYTNYVRPIRKF